MGGESTTPQYGYQSDKQFLKILDELKAAREDIVKTRDWYKAHARQPMLWFRMSQTPKGS